MSICMLECMHMSCILLAEVQSERMTEKGVVLCLNEQGHVLFCSKNFTHYILQVMKQVALAFDFIVTYFLYCDNMTL